MDEPQIEEGRYGKNRSYWVLAILFFFALPIVAVNLPGISIWLGRTIAVSSFTFFMSVAIFWFGLSPKTKMITGKGGLADRKYDNARPKIELGIRIAVVAFGILFLVYKTLPLASDLAHLAAGEKPTRLTATITYRTSSFGGVLLGERSVQFARGGQSYYLFYSWTSTLRVGESYEFTVLPRSRLILDFRESGE